MEYLIICNKAFYYLTPRTSSDSIWVEGHFGQPLTYPFVFMFYSLQSQAMREAFIHTKWSCEQKVKVVCPL
jgi:hypothetical protein